MCESRHIAPRYPLAIHTRVGSPRINDFHRMGGRLDSHTDSHTHTHTMAAMPRGVAVQGVCAYALCFRYDSTSTAQYHVSLSITFSRGAHSMSFSIYENRVSSCRLSTEGRVCGKDLNVGNSRSGFKER